MPNSKKPQCSGLKKKQKKRANRYIVLRLSFLIHYNQKGMLLSILLLVVKLEGPGELSTAIAATLFGLSFITITMTIMMYADPGLIIHQDDADVHFKRYTRGKPVLKTYCEVFEAKHAPWLECILRETIWRETKSFEYKHWVDATDQTLIKSMNCFTFLLFDFEVKFADSTTETAYYRYLQTLIGELPEYCLDRNRKMENMISVCGEKEGRMFVAGKYFWFFRIPVLSIVSFPLFFAALRWGLWDRVARRITIKKIITMNNLEVVV